MTEKDLYIAVDLGAGSGRVFLGGFGEEFFLLEEMHRFQYPPRFEDGHWRWSFGEIFENIKSGLKKSAERAGELKQKINSIGVDSWGVDYGLIDAGGKLLENPICYRDERTKSVTEKVFSLISREKIFERTGIQFLSFNTIFQLYAHRQSGIPAGAAKLLLIPDLINFFLTGKAVTEYTNATTTQILDAETGNWDYEIIESLGLPKSLLTEIVPAGTDLGPLRPELAAELSLENVRVIVPATHDTGSAVIGAPLEPNWAYISSGTWSLVGVERDKVLIDDQAGFQNFTNEGGAFGTIRLLKNVIGLWIFESCRREWRERGIGTDYAGLLREVAALEGFKGFIYPDDERFLNPPGMLNAIAEQMRETGQTFDENPAVVTKIILDSLAFRYASVLRTIENLTGQNLAGVQIVGGGGRNEYLNQMTADTSGLTVKSGLTEATVTGNLLVQAISAGRFASLTEARNYVAEHIELKNFVSKASTDLEIAKQNYEKIEMILTGKMTAN